MFYNMKEMHSLELENIKKNIVYFIDLLYYF